MRLLAKIFRNTISLTGTEILTRIMTFITVAYLARTLTVSGFGMMSFALAILTFFLLLGDLGLKNYGSREAARNKAGINETVSYVVSLRIVLAPIIFGILFLTLHFLDTPPELRRLIQLYGLALFAEAILLEWTFFGIHELAHISVSRIIRVVTYCSLILLLVKSREDLLLVPLFYFIGILSAAIYLLIVHLKIEKRFKLVFSGHHWKTIVGQALPMGLAFIMTQIYFNLDTVILGVYKGSQTVGWYNAGYKVVFFLITFCLVYHNTLYPLMSKYYRESNNQLSTLIYHSTKYFVYLSLPLAVGGTILARSIITSIFGPEYLNGVLPFQILLWSFVISNVTAVFGNALMASDNQKRYLVGVSMGAGLNLILNIVLIPRFGLIGAAVSTVVSQSIVLTFMYWSFELGHSMGLFGLFPKPLFANLVMAGALLGLQRFDFLLLIPLGGVVYLATIIGIKGFTSKEIQLVKQLVFIKQN